MSTPRITWNDLPPVIQRRVEEVIGGPVTQTRSVVGGFSPGTAERVVTASGVRAFVKAVHPTLNEKSPELYRQEIRAMRHLPDAAPAAHLRASFELDGWVVLVLEDIEGRMPELPWVEHELRALLDALDGLAQATCGTDLSDLPSASDEIGESLRGLDRLVSSPPEPGQVPAWILDNLPELRARATRGQALLDGPCLVHADTRADNVLLTPDGGVRIVDWPFACRGAAWVDAALLVSNIDGQLVGSLDIDAAVDAFAGRWGASPTGVTDVTCGLLGYFADVARRPAPAGLPTIRTHQAASRDRVVAVVQRRMARGA